LHVVIGKILGHNWWLRSKFLQAQPAASLVENIAEKIRSRFPIAILLTTLI
jgi:hypothetical protein